MYDIIIIKNNNAGNALIPSGQHFTHQPVSVCTFSQPPASSHWLTSSVMLLGSLAPLATEKPSDVFSSAPASRHEYL